MSDLQLDFLKMLNDKGGSLLLDRYQWMRGVSKDNCRLEKLYVIYGYLMAMEDLGHLDQDLRVILHQIIDEEVKKRGEGI